MNLNLKARVALLVGASFALFLMTAAYITSNYISLVFELRHGKETMAVLDQISNLKSAMALERGISASHLSGGADKKLLEEKRSHVDKAIPKAIEAFEGSYISKFNPEALKNLESDTQAARVLVNSQATKDNVILTFNAIIDGLIDIYVLAAKNTTHAGFSSELRSLSMIESAKDKAGRFRARLTSISAKDQPIPPQELKDVAALKAMVEGFLKSRALVLSSDGTKARNELFNKKSWRDANAFYLTIIDNFGTGSFGLNATMVFDTLTIVVDEIGSLRATEAKATIKTLEEDLFFARVALYGFAIFLLFSPMVPVKLGNWVVNAIMLPIKATIGELDRASKRISSASTHLTKASSTLSSGFQETAASLQETVSTMSEMNSMLGTTLEKTKETQASSNSVSLEVHEGDATVREMVRSMDEIQAANHQLEEIGTVIHEVSEKTKVINDIVFKTQLLSFNASIEAARAGQHGKGFAVVAEEVGNLAQTSGGASNEISNMIQESQKRVNTIVRNTTERIDTGKTVTRKVNNTFSHISEKISAITDQIQVITEASNEQKLGIEQITTAFSEIDTSTQASLKEVNLTSELANQLEEESRRLESATDGLMRLVNGSKYEQKRTHKDQTTEGTPYKPSPSIHHERAEDRPSDESMIQDLTSRPRSPAHLTENFPQDIDADDESFVERKAG